MVSRIFILVVFASCALAMFNPVLPMSHNIHKNKRSAEDTCQVSVCASSGQQCGLLSSGRVAVCTPKNDLRCSSADAVCSPAKEDGEPCNGNSECLWSCHPTRKTCSFMSFGGAECQKDANCYSGNCTNGICQGAAIGERCENAIECANYGRCAPSKCDPNSRVCAPTLYAGDECTSYSDCIFGFSCSATNSSRLRYECTPLFSRKQGEFCEATEECGDEMSCLENTCARVTGSPSLRGCTNNTDCAHDEECICTGEEGKLKCVKVFFNPVRSRDIVSTISNCVITQCNPFANGYTDDCLFGPCRAGYCALPPFYTEAYLQDKARYEPPCLLDASRAYRTWFEENITPKCHISSAAPCETRVCGGGDKCCADANLGEVCYNPTTHLCSANSVGTYLCGSRDKVCGSGVCYNPVTHKCCNNQLKGILEHC